MRHGSLFSGIGGFDLASEWMGWENVFHCEWMPFPQKILKHYWPNAISYHDITKTDFTIHRGTIDILSGGFPCQPYSMAGKRLGKEDERHLWPEMLRAIKEIQPTWVVGENVYGLTNWNGGMVFEEVCVDLENCGYEVQPIVLPACSVNAPHRRDRVWFVAYANSFGNRRKSKQSSIAYQQGRGGKIDSRIGMQKQQQPFCNITNKGITTDPGNKGLQRIKVGRGIETSKSESYQFTSRCLRTKWQNFPTQSPICGGDDGISTQLDGITFSKWRQESIKGYGNAVVPQLVFEIFKVIEQMHNQ